MIFDDIYRQCNTGKGIDKIHNIPEFPRMLDLELTNRCNFKCKMCPTGTGEMKRDDGVMRIATLLEIISQIGERQTPVRLIRWGEPTLHLNFIDFLILLKDAEIPVHINTNGFKMDVDMMRAFIHYGLDSIKFSFQGVDSPGYYAVRGKDFFEKLLSKITMLHSLRGDRPKPHIHISTTVESDEDPDAIEDFRKEAEMIADKVTVGRTKWKGDMPNNIKHHECPEVFDKLSINWNGDVTACCADYDDMMIVGNVHKNSIEEIWHGEKINKFRVMLAEHEHDLLPLCKNCYNYISVVK